MTRFLVQNWGRELLAAGTSERSRRYARFDAFFTFIGANKIREREKPLLTGNVWSDPAQQSPASDIPQSKRTTADSNFLKY